MEREVIYVAVNLQDTLHFMSRNLASGVGTRMFESIGPSVQAPSPSFPSDWYISATGAYGYITMSCRYGCACSYYTVLVTTYLKLTCTSGSGDTRNKLSQT